MGYEQMIAAMKAIAPDAAIYFRGPRDWYVGRLPEVGGDGLLSGIAGRAPDPVAAIQDAWDRLIAVQAPKYLVIRAMSNDRRQVRWNGFMWEDVPITTTFGQTEGE